MYKLNRQSYAGLGLLLLFAAYTLTSSCVTEKRIYFGDINNDSLAAGAPPAILKNATPFVDPKIEPNDVLAITIQTIAQNEGSNTPITTNSAGSFNPLNGFLVDRNGYIELSLIGFVKVGGLTTTEAREVVKQKAKEYWKEPVVNVRISNFDIVVLGDVGKPGTITSASEKISIIDAIALSGDLNITAKRKNILLVRTDGDEKTFIRFDMTKSSIFQSPYFYLKQRDLLYVEPSRVKVESANNVFTLFSAYFSFLVSIVTVFFAFKIIK